MIVFRLEGNGVGTAMADGASPATALLVGVFHTVFVFGGPGGGAWIRMCVWIMAKHYHRLNRHATALFLRPLQRVVVISFA